MTKRNLPILVGAVIVVLLIALGGGLVAWRMFFHHYHVDVTIADTIVINSEWTEIRPPEPLRVEKENQFVSIGVVSPSSLNARGKGIASPDGKVATPEIKVISTDGVEYPMTYLEGRIVGGLFETIEYASYGYKNGLPKSIKIEKILLRSDVPIPARKILWSGFNWKDLP